VKERNKATKSLPIGIYKQDMQQRMRDKTKEYVENNLVEKQDRRRNFDKNEMNERKKFWTFTKHLEE